ncbi:T9SS type A sorting domain-containing protein [candidate division TA06 bacterium]|nr:T9SS type A sorting domain-containing protein [candidate division TA06 bacterium]
MAFDYTGDNAFMDWIATDTLSFVIFKNSATDSSHGIAYDNGGCTYKTIGTSFEFGGLEDASERVRLADSIMNFFCVPKVTFAWDVMVSSIDTPATYTLQTVFPEVTVRNQGLNTASFDVAIEINPGGYSGITTVTNLLPDESRSIPFTNPWTPGGCGTQYTTTAYTLLATDMRPANDTLTKDVTAWDDSWEILSPYTNTPPTNDGVIGAAEWQDATLRDISDFIGNGMQAFPCGSAMLYVMNDNENVYFAFDFTRDFNEDESDMAVLFLEDNHDHAWPPRPDSSEGEFQAFHIPPPAVPSFHYSPKFCCPNGQGPRGFIDIDGFSSINSGNMQFEFTIPLGDTNYFLNAQMGDTIGMFLHGGHNLEDPSGLNYAYWPSSAALGFGVINDMGDLILSVGGLVHDGSVDTILSPAGLPDSIFVGTPFNPIARVRNAGTLVESNFNVICTVRGTNPYDDTVTVPNLDPDSTVQVTFARLWTPTTAAIDTMSVCVEVPNDSNSTNDCFTILIQSVLPIGVEEEPVPILIPKAFGLSQGRPNPTSSTVQIRFDLPRRSRVHLLVYDITGRVVKVLLDGIEETGYRSVVWDGREETGREAASGVYFYKLTADSGSGSPPFEATRKIVLLR